MRGIKQALSILSSHAIQRLDDEELKTLSGAQEHADLIIEQARTLFEGIGCLVNEDKSTGSLTSSGEVAQLAFFAANLFDMVSGLITLGDQAQYMIETKAHAKASQSPPLPTR